MPWVLDGIDLGNHVLEVGPGPGLTTNLLRQRAARLTSIEIDARLASALRRRLDGTNVTVVEGDATALPFTDAAYCIRLMRAASTACTSSSGTSAGIGSSRCAKAALPSLTASS